MSYLKTLVKHVSESPQVFSIFLAAFEFQVENRKGFLSYPRIAHRSEQGALYSKYAEWNSTSHVSLSK